MSKMANYLHMMKSPMVTDLLEENRRLKAKIDTLHEVIQMCLSNPRPVARVSTRKPLRKPPAVAIKIEPGLEVVSDIEMDVSEDGDSHEEASDEDSDIMVVDSPQKKENIVYQLEEVPIVAEEAAQAGAPASEDEDEEEAAQASDEEEEEEQAGEEEEEAAQASEEEEEAEEVEAQASEEEEEEAQASEEEEEGEEEEEEAQASEEEEEEESAPVDKVAPADAPADEEEEVYEVTIKGKTYYVVNEQNGPIYAADADGDVGDQVGKYVNGVATF